MSYPFHPLAFCCCQTQMVREGAFSYKMDLVKYIVNHKGYQKCVIVSKFTTIWLKICQFAKWLSCIWEGLCAASKAGFLLKYLQP